MGLLLFLPHPPRCLSPLDCRDVLPKRPSSASSASQAEFQDLNQLPLCPSFSMCFYLFVYLFLRSPSNCAMESSRDQAMRRALDM